MKTLDIDRGVGVNLQRTKFSQYELGFMLLLIINPCFYNLKTMRLYIGLGGFAIILIIAVPFINGFREKKMIARKSELWMTLIYAIFLTYGLLFLRASEFQADFIFFTYVSNIALIIALRKIMQMDGWATVFARVFLASTLFVILYLFTMERSIFGQTGIRIGSSLSGNVNTVGACLGIMTLFLSFVYSKTKYKILLPLYAVTVIMMLLTGSKKTVVYFGISLVIYLFYSKRKFKGIIIAALAVSVVYYLIMNVPYFYSVIGRRIDGMISYVSGSNDVLNTYSTMERQMMISEGIRIFFEKPIFGGGQGYFALRSSSGYGYSHCNYIELLCNYGLVGTILYYTPAIRNFVILFRSRKEHRDFAILGCSLIFAMLLVDWMMVSYSSISLYYLPIITSFVLVEKINTDAIRQ